MDIEWEIRMHQGGLEMLRRSKIQCKIIKLVDLTFFIRKVAMLPMVSYLKRLHHVELTVITPDKFHKPIQITLLKEWPKVKLEHNLNINNLKNKIIMKTLIGLKLILLMRHHQKKWLC